MHVTSLLYQMLRLRTALLLLLFVAIGDAATKTNPNAYSPRLLLVLAVLAAWYIYSTSTNDLADEQVDKINLKGNAQRPLANGHVQRRKLWIAALGCGVTASIFAWLVSPMALLACLGALGLSFIYSFPPIRLSARGIVAPLALPIGYVLFPFFLVMQANHAYWSQPLTWLIAALYLSFSGRIILKDFRDVVGDRKFGKRTFLVRYGATATCWLSGLLWLVGYGFINYRFHHQPLVSLCILPLLILIMLGLRHLPREDIIKEQLQYVGLVGRLANGSALLILVGLYAELTPEKASLYKLLLLLVGCFGLLSTWVLYEKPLRKLL